MITGLDTIIYGLKKFYEWIDTGVLEEIWQARHPKATERFIELCDGLRHALIAFVEMQIEDTENIYRENHLEDQPEITEEKIGQSLKEMIQESPMRLNQEILEEVRKNAPSDAGEYAIDIDQLVNVVHYTGGIIKSYSFCEGEVPRLAGQIWEMKEKMAEAIGWTYPDESVATPGEKAS